MLGPHKVPEHTNLGVEARGCDAEDVPHLADEGPHEGVRRQGGEEGFEDRDQFRLAARVIIRIADSDEQDLDGQLPGGSGKQAHHIRLPPRNTHLYSITGSNIPNNIKCMN